MTHWQDKVGYRHGKWYVFCGCGEKFYGEMLADAERGYEGHAK